MRIFLSITLFTFGLQNLAARELHDRYERLRECEILQSSYFKYINPEVKVLCNRDFHLYESTKYKKSRASKIKLVSFNIYKLNHGVTRFKSLTKIAKIFKQEKWDMIAVQEIFPMSSDQYDRISDWDKMPTTFKAKEINRQSFKEPSYITLLEELRRSEPKAGWSLILSNQARGSSASALELSGYYYKKSKLKLISNKYCQKHALAQKSKRKGYACMPELNGFEKKTVSRPPFIASFKSKNFDYIALTKHARFRLPRHPSIQGKEDEELITKVFKTYLGEDLPALSDELLYRAAEAKIFIKKMDEIAKLSKEKDIIIMGDFNLELPDSKDDFVRTIPSRHIGELENLWENILSPFPGLEVFGKDESSLSMMGRLKSNYDHFIYNQNEGFSQECGEVSTFDFTDKKYSGLENYFDKKRWPKFISDYEKKIRNEKIVVKGKVKNLYSEKEILLEVAEFKKRLFESQSQTNSEGVLKWKYKVHQEILSDHLPIAITCQAQKDDD